MTLILSNLSGAVISPVVGLRKKVVILLTVTSRENAKPMSTHTHTR